MEAQEMQIKKKIELTRKLAQKIQNCKEDKDRQME